MSDPPRTPTRSEINLFKVLANMDQTDLKRPDPTGWTSKVDDEHAAAEAAAAETAAAEAAAEIAAAEAEAAALEAAAELAAAEAKAAAELAAAEAARAAQAAAVANTVAEEETHENFMTMREKLIEDPFEEKRQEKPKSAWRDPVLLEKARADAAAEERVEKEGLLYELDLMERQGNIKLHRELTMENSLEEIQYQYDRANMIVSTQQTVDWAKTSIQVGSGVLEAVAKRFGLHAVDGFSKNLCKDMNKFNKPLTKMYRKYWRRGTSSPEMELAMIVFGSLVMTVVGNKGGGSLFGGGEPKAVKVPTAAVAPSAPMAPSAIRQPFSVSQQLPQQPPMPEWAKAALKEQKSEPEVKEAPTRVDRIPEKTEVKIDVSEPVKQSAPFNDAQKETPLPGTTEDMFPELAPPLKVPMTQIAQSMDTAVRRLTISDPSPRQSSRRRVGTSARVLSM